MSAALEQLMADARKAFEADDHSRPEYRKMLDLAAAKYPPARALFIEFLHSPAARWRSKGLSALTTKYELSGDAVTLDMVRQLLLSDEDEEVRTKAAVTLYGHSTWPDAALRQAVENDSSMEVRREVFKAILQMNGLRQPTLDTEVAKIDSGATIPTMATAKAVLESHGKTLRE
jgi:hypothetical protein